MADLKIHALAYDFEATGPSVFENRVLAVGTAWAEIRIREGVVSCTLLGKNRICCWDGDLAKKWDEKTRRYWVDEVGMGVLDQLKSADSDYVACRKFCDHFQAVYENAKRSGAEFVSVNDRAAFDTVWLSAWSSKNNPGRRPLPMFAPSAEQEMLECIDVSALSAGMVMASVDVEAFYVATDSTKSAFSDCFGYKKRVQPAGKAHLPEHDAELILMRFVDALRVQQGEAPAKE